jgi:acyl carrier protein
VSNETTLDSVAIEEIVLKALRSANLSRPVDQQLEVSQTATIFGANSRMDSLGLVALLIDVEEALNDRGVAITLTDARAMSETRSPFRTVPALVAYITQLVSGSPQA